MSTDYRRGKSMACRWADHWDWIAEMSSRGGTVEAELMDYHQSIRVAFKQREIPEYFSVMQPYVKTAHYHIMGLPVEQREALVVWHFGDESERLAEFNSHTKEPSKMAAIYKRLGRRHRGTHQRKPKKER